jgi:hypothetical protein
VNAPSPTDQRKSLRQLRESTGTLFAKNNTPHKVTCNTDSVSFELEPKGYDDSIRIVPKECLNVPGFQRLWMKKHITVSDDEAMENEITLLMGGLVEAGPRPVQVQKQDGTWVEETPEIREPAGKNSFSVPVDTDPNSRTYGQAMRSAGDTCLFDNERVFLTDRDKEAGVPPLCPAHAGESHRVVSTPHADGSWSHQLSTLEPTQKGLD